MSIEIVWPERRSLPHHLIELWFVEALVKGRIHPTDCGARTSQAMAEALDNAGIIRLLVNNSCDNPDIRKDES